MTENQGAQAPPAVLIIDDEDYVADMIATALAIDGYNVQVAYNGREGLECAHRDRFDVIVIDIMMPYMSGEELMVQLRSDEQTQSTPIILISAGARPRHQISNATFLPKPFDIDHMLSLVRNYVE